MASPHSQYMYHDEIDIIIHARESVKESSELGNAN